MLTDVIAYGAGAREAALDDEALLSRLGQARRRLAPPFAPERVDLVASVAGTLLGPQRSAASGPAHFAFWTRRAALAKLAAGFAARVPASALARPRGLVFHLPPQNVETVFLYSWVLLPGRKRQYRAAAARDQRPNAGDRRSLSRTPASFRRRQPIVRPLPVAGRSRGENLRSQRCARRLGRRRQGRAVRTPAPAKRVKVNLVRRPVFLLDDQRRGSRRAGRCGAERRSPKSCTTTSLSLTRWPARPRTRSMSSAKPRLIRRRSGASSTLPRSRERWMIRRAGSDTRSAR